MRVQRAVRPHQPRLGRGQLAPAVDHLALGAHARHLGREGLHQVHAQLCRGVGAPGRHHGVHGAAQRRIQQRGKPAAVHRAHGVEQLRPRRALEHRAALADLDHHEVERFGNRRVGQRAVQHALHQLQPRQAGDLVHARHAGAGTFFEAFENRLFIGKPLVEMVLGHGSSRVSLWHMMHRLQVDVSRARNSVFNTLP